MCHKTAGLVARGLEHAGIATVVIGTMHKPMDTVPRGVVTPYINCPIGPAGDGRIQHDVVGEALRLLRSATAHTVETVYKDQVPS